MKCHVPAETCTGKENAFNIKCNFSKKQQFQLWNRELEVPQFTFVEIPLKRGRVNRIMNLSVSKNKSNSFSLGN